MRILHCLRAPVGGLFRHVLDLAGEQAARGHDVGIIAESNAEDGLTGRKFEKIAPALRLGLLRTPMSRKPGFGDWRAYRTVLDHARLLNLDIVHGHGAKGGAYARLARRALRRSGSRVQAYYTPHGGSLNLVAGAAATKILLAAERRLETMTDGLIFESAFAARTYERRIGRPRAPLRVIPNGLQPEDFKPPGLSPDATDFLYLGELRALKGVGHLLEALARPEHSGATATIVGTGPAEAELRTQAGDLGLSARTRFTGALPAREAFPLGRIMVVPSLAESFPYIVLEAAAAGLPLIATSVGGIPEIVAGTDTHLIPPASTVALAGAMASALSHHDLSAARALRLKENVAAKFTVAGMTDAVLAFYELTDC